MLRTLLLGLSCVSLAAAAPAPPRPKLVVLFSIDQFRADYIRRFTPYFLPAKANGKVGGFRYMMETGADYADAHHAHAPPRPARDTRPFSPERSPPRAESSATIGTTSRPTSRSTASTTPSPNSSAPARPNR